ncbi:MAG: hypothetical protein H6823_22495 [Planctomycetaceae bacterium]|nr:hypothetical protein [Planctomycetales bacterium]MCB9941014.1 hypothetical protein [Planctomycetaceae bacterium]
MQSALGGRNGDRLDFGKVYIDHQPEHTDEVLQEWNERQQEIWGNRWADVQSILWQLRRIGIHYQDPNTDNIRF